MGCTDASFVAHKSSNLSTLCLVSSRILTDKSQNRSEIARYDLRNYQLLCIIKFSAPLIQCVENQQRSNIEREKVVSV